MSNNTLQLKVSEKKDKTTDEVFFEGTVTIPGMKPTKLVKTDGTTRFPKRANVVQSGKRLATKIGFGFEDAQPVAKAAKKSVKKSKKTSSDSTSECCDGGSCSTPWVAN